MAQARPSAIFVADCLGLDFLNSAAAAAGDRIDWMASGAILMDWLEQAQAAPATILHNLRLHVDPDALDPVAARARGLRDWLAAFISEHRGRPLPELDLGSLNHLNQILDEDGKYQQIVLTDPSAKVLKLTHMRRWLTPDSLLYPIVEAVARLICEVDFTRVKMCRGAGCSLLFVDQTRGQIRKWCNMARCGNRAKQATHRSARRPSDDAG